MKKIAATLLAQLPARQPDTRDQQRLYIPGLRPTVRSFYTLQQQRMNIGQQILAHFNRKMNLQTDPMLGNVEDDAESLNTMRAIKSEYEKVTVGVANLMAKNANISFIDGGLISHRAELVLLTSFFELLNLEEREAKALSKIVEEHVVYKNFLSKIRGLGPILSAVILTEFDISRARYPSSLWAYSGYDVASDGLGRSARVAHRRSEKYITFKQELKERAVLSYNPFLKSKLWLLATSFIKHGVRWNDVGQAEFSEASPWHRRKTKGDTPVYQVATVQGKYAQCILQYKHRLQNSANERWVKASPAHINAAALRYGVKMFMLDLYKVWRTAEDLEVSPPYHEAKLHMAPHRGGDTVFDAELEGILASVRPTTTMPLPDEPPALAVHD